MNISRVLVIGGAGYIGAHTVDSMLSHGYAVTVFDNLLTGKKEHLSKEVSFIKGSILNITALNKAFEESKPDAVIHLAALKAAGESMRDGVAYSDTNIVGTINILKAMIKYNIHHIVFSSTAATYGEPQYLPMDEEHLQMPTNYYGATKLIVETIFEWYAKIYDINYASLRYFNAAGHTPSTKFTVIEQNPQNLIPIILETALGIRKTLQIFGNDYPTHDGTCLRDYIHVCDIAEAHALSLQYLSEHTDSLQLNLGTGNSFSVLEVYKMACEITKIDIPMEFVERRHGDPDSVYAKSILAYKKIKWKPQYNKLEDMIEHAWLSYLRYGKKISAQNKSIKNAQ